MLFKKLIGSLGIGFLRGSVLFCLFTSSSAVAQIVPDNTLPRNSIVTPQDNIIQIDGGTRAGNNLFHSFEQFSVQMGETAFFNNAVEIQNILSRVTGGSISEINGILKANGVANLFLINPNGIIFGENASLDIGGSFFATSADSVIFANGAEFSATNPNTPPLLTINIPIGLWFRENPGPIVNRSQVGLIKTNDRGENLGIVPLSLLQPGQTVALVGGEINLEGGFLVVEGGRVELGSVAGNSLVSLTPVAEGFSLGYEGVQSFQDISLSDKALVDTSGEGGGEIQIQGRRVTLTGDTVVLSSTLGSEAGGDVVVKASESVDLSGSATLATETLGTGNAGNLTIETRELTARDGAFIATQANSLAMTQPGNLTIRASEFVELEGTISDGEFPTEVSASVLDHATGQGRTLTIDTQKLIIRDGAQVSAATSGIGQGVNVIVRASELIKLENTSQDGRLPSGLFARVQEEATGKGGTLTVETEQLVIQGGAQISTDTRGAGLAGNLRVNADQVELLNTSADGMLASGLFAQVTTGATGDGGNLTVNARRLVVLGGAQISTSARSGGEGGTLTINAAESILVSGTSPLEDLASNSNILVSAQPGATRDAGELIINTPELIVEDGARISADNFGTGGGSNVNLNVERLIIRDGGQIGAGSLIGEEGLGNERGPGGTLTINASEAVEITGTGTVGSTPVNSRLFTLAEGTGDAGNLTIFTPNLTVTDGGEVNVSATGMGEAGSLTVGAGSIRLEDGSLSAETRVGTEGNITLNAQEIQLRRGSEITTNSLDTGSGGNITINSNQLVAIENSDISANALAGSGGQVIINSDVIFGTQFRPQQTNASDITATSELGPEFSGTVELDSEIDPAQGLIELPQTVVDPAALIAQDVCKQGQGSEFINTGRGGIPPSPEESLRSEETFVELIELPEVESRRRRTPSSRNSTTPSRVQRNASRTSNQPRSTLNIVPARGWIRDENGDVILVSYDPTKTGVQRQRQPAIQCQP